MHWDHEPMAIRSPVLRTRFMGRLAAVWLSCQHRPQMKRRWNMSLWAGFFFVVIGLLSYVPVFSLFPITRDFPWVNLLFFAVGVVLLGAGLRRAFRQPELYRGRILGSIL